MSTVTWVEKGELQRTAAARFLQTDVLLDIGCGIMPQTFVTPAVHICAEPFEEYVKVLQAKIEGSADRSYVILKNTWSEVLDILPARSIDTVVLADVIEHLEKDVAAELLRRTQLLARRQVLIFTPLGFLPQSHPDGTDAWGLGGGAWQEHKSGWVPDDFGEGWEFVGTRQYYFEDNMGRPFEQPFGAFWAIRTCGSEADEIQLAKRSLGPRFSVVALALNYSVLVRQTLNALELWARVRGGLSGAKQSVRSWLRGQ
jgi:hypothetical protein